MIPLVDLLSKNYCK